MIICFDHITVILRAIVSIKIFKLKLYKIMCLLIDIYFLLLSVTRITFIYFCKNYRILNISWN